MENPFKFTNIRLLSTFSVFYRSVNNLQAAIAPVRELVIEEDDLADVYNHTNTIKQR